MIECFLCKQNEATHKVGEESSHGKPVEFSRHNLTNFICCECFGLLMGSGTNWVCTTAFEAWERENSARARIERLEEQLAALEVPRD